MSYTFLFLRQHACDPTVSFVSESECFLKDTRRIRALSPEKLTEWTNHCKKKNKNKWICHFFFGILTKKCDYRNSFNINLCFNPCSRSWFWHFVRHFFTRQVHWDVWKHFCNEPLVEKYSQETCSSASLVIYFLMPSCHSLHLSVLQSVVVSCSACPLHLCRHSSFIISSASSASAESSATAGVWTLWGDQSSPPLTADAPRSQTRRDSIIMYHPLW